MKFPRRQFLRLAAGAAALPAVSPGARAQAYPTRPVRLIVPFPPAGGSDVMARLISQWLSERLGQPATDGVDRALLGGRMQTVLGWRRRGCEGARPTELMNWPIQSTGADLMRIVCIAATEAGIEVAAPVHDAFLIVCPLDRLDQDVAHMREIMIRASKVVTSGLPIRVDEKVVRFPDRYIIGKYTRKIDPWG